MKLSYYFLSTLSLLITLTGCFPAEVYADYSSQNMGNDNKNSPQINGDNNTVCYQCTNYNVYDNESVTSTDQPSFSPETENINYSGFSRIPVSKTYPESSSSHRNITIPLTTTYPE